MVSRTYAKWEAEEMMPLYEKLYDTERKVFQDSGIKFIKFSEKDAKWFNNIVEEVYWEDSGKRLGDKEYVNKIRKIMGK
jgi:hypothetical protein